MTHKKNLWKSFGKYSNLGTNLKTKTHLFVVASAFTFFIGGLLSCHKGIESTPLIIENVKEVENSREDHKVPEIPGFFENSGMDDFAWNPRPKDQHNQDGKTATKGSLSLKEKNEAILKKMLESDVILTSGKESVGGVDFYITREAFEEKIYGFVNPSKTEVQILPGMSVFWNGISDRSTPLQFVLNKGYVGKIQVGDQNLKELYITQDLRDWMSPGLNKQQEFINILITKLYPELKDYSFCNVEKLLCTITPLPNVMKDPNIVQNESFQIVIDNLALAIVNYKIATIVLKKKFKFSTHLKKVDLILGSWQAVSYKYIQSIIANSPPQVETTEGAIEFALFDPWSKVKNRFPKPDNEFGDYNQITMNSGLFSFTNNHNATSSNSASKSPARMVPFSEDSYLSGFALRTNKIFKERTQISLGGQQVYIQCEAETGKPRLGTYQKDFLPTTPPPPPFSPFLVSNQPIQEPPMLLTLDYPCNPTLISSFIADFLRLVQKNPVFSEGIFAISKPYIKNLASSAGLNPNDTTASSAQSSNPADSPKLSPDWKAQSLIVKENRKGIYYIFEVAYKEQENLLQFHVSTFSKTYQTGLLEKIINGENPLLEDRFFSILLGMDNQFTKESSQDSSPSEGHPDHARNTYNVPDSPETIDGFTTEPYIFPTLSGPTSLHFLYGLSKVIPLFPYRNFQVLIVKDLAGKKTWTHSFQLGFWINPISVLCPTTPPPAGGSANSEDVSPSDNAVNFEFQEEKNRVIKNLTEKKCFFEIYKSPDGLNIESIFLPTNGLQLNFEKNKLVTIKKYDFKFLSSNDDMTNGNPGGTNK